MKLIYNNFITIYLHHNHMACGFNCCKTEQRSHLVITEINWLSTNLIAVLHHDNGWLCSIPCWTNWRYRKLIATVYYKGFASYGLHKSCTLWGTDDIHSSPPTHMEYYYCNYIVKCFCPSTFECFCLLLLWLNILSCMANQRGWTYNKSWGWL